MISVSSMLLSILPILVIVFMLLKLKKPADITGLVGLVVVALIAIAFFDTSVEVVARSTVAGLIKSFPVSLIVAASLLQMAFMQSSGALKRIIIFIKTISLKDRATQIILLNIGFGTLMVSVGATPVSLLPPILLAMGYSTYNSIALPAIGYDSLCTYALLGAPIVVFVDVFNGFVTMNKTGELITLSDAAQVFYFFLPLVATLIGFSMLYIVGGFKEVRKGIIPCITAGIIISVVAFFTSRVDNLVPITGVACGLAVMIGMSLYIKARGGKVIDSSLLTTEEKEYAKSYSLLRALLPWIFLIVLILAFNLPKASFNYLYYKLLLPVEGLTANGLPISTRALWNAYTWIFVSIIVSLPFMKMKKSQIKEAFKLWGKRAPRPVLAAAIFFSIGEIMNMAGYSMAKGDFTQLSMISNLAKGSAQLFDQAYVFVAPFVGLVGGFITGSEASTIAMFGNYALATANTLGHNTTGMIIIAAGVAFGGGLASVISPAKLQNAAASIDRLGEETKVIPMAFVFSIILTTITAIFASVYLFLVK